MNRPNDEPNTAITPQPASGPGASARSRGLRFKLAALALTLSSALAGTGLARWLKAPAPELAKPEAKVGIPARLFPNWGKPDFVLILSAQQHGYMLPCGCSRPQVGGLERRYNFMQLLKERGWTPVAVDLGDVPQKSGPAKLPNVQGVLKYQYSMKALDRMGYLGVGVGEFEAGYSLARIEGEWAANNDTPAVLAGNLKEPDNFPFLKSIAVRTVAGSGVRVGVTSVVGPTVAEHIKDPAVKFERTAESLNQLLRKMQAAKVDLPILLYHGLATPRKGDEVKEAIACAEKYPQFPVIVCLSEEDEPPADPIAVDHPRSGTRNYVFRLGHKGKNIGVLGVYRSGPGNAFNFKYKLVEMGEEYMTPKEQEADHPIQKMMEDYTRELKDKNYLARYGQSKHILQVLPPVEGLGNEMPTFIGSEGCRTCHRSAFKVWKGTPHSHAYQTLVDASHPSLRQYDGECIVCHTVGFGSTGGFTDEKKTTKLMNVGCESCHGPGSLHAKNPHDPEWQQRMNQPWRGAKNADAKKLAIDRFCQSCHDIDNDVTWIHNAFPAKWKKIIHTKD